MSRGQRLQEIGGVARDNISELVDRSDIVFMSLSDDAALKEILDRVLDDPAADLSGKVIVDTSTVHPKSSNQAHQRVTQRGMKFIAAPVFGASPVAAEGKLLWVIAGPDDAVQLITPFIVGIMGRRIIRLGDDVTQSSMLKTAGNFMTAGMMELVAEAHVFAEKTGLGTEAMEELIEHQYGPLALSMSKRLTTGAYLPARGQRPWSDLGLALKDIGHGIDCAEGSGSRLEVAEVALRHLTEARAYSDVEGRPLDSSSMYGVLRREAGLSFETDLVKKRDNDDE
ncbi:2-(hydroxymethyl)glutarate dehydrogenase [Colletotrichum spinosum]|uniref:2-(Hydroxymethyl)glutarate dehydrogenase n=1 Tax=Colletotrichum spinosum TaxID=1347390 RepID=A0A4R8Q921_9PEZI|nr:2-(hydroxymethyl)glutarate dehydrogenase [Colletotrichum spinosum]